MVGSAMSCRKYVQTTVKLGVHYACAAGLVFRQSMGQCGHGDGAGELVFSPKYPKPCLCARKLNKGGFDGAALEAWQMVDIRTSFIPFSRVHSRWRVLRGFVFRVRF